MRPLRTRAWLWFALSLGIFIGIGLFMRFQQKGVSISVFQAYADWLSEGIHYERFFVLFFCAWLLAAIMVGWFLQALVVIITSRYARPRPTA